MTRLNRLFFLGLLAVLAGPMGCSRHRGSDAAEQEHPRMRRAASYVQQQDLDAAADIYAELIRRYPDFASAHLQLGLIHQRRQQPVAAIYHFQQYLAQRGEGSKGPTVEQMIQSELIRIVDNHPAVRAMTPPDILALQDEITRLQQRLDQAEARAARAELTSRQGQQGAAAPPSAPAAAPQVTVTAPPPAPAAPTAPPAPPANVRVHVVQRGETLSSISQKVYNTPHRWREILEANRETLPRPERLDVGQTLIIP